MNKKFLGLALLLIIIIMISLSACSSPVQLSVPQNINIEGNLLTWDSVENASDYIVSIDNREYTANINEYRIVVDEVRQYSIRVKAVGDGKNYSNSDFSSHITYIPTSGDPSDPSDPVLPRLSTPSGVRISEGQLTWNLINFAVGYRVEVTAPNNAKTYSNVSAPPFNVVGDMDGVYSLRVLARADTSTHRDSIYSSDVKYEIKDGSFAEVVLRAPVQLSYSNGVLSWSRVNNASGYVINIDDVDSYTLMGSSTNYYSLDFDTVRVRQIKVKALGDGALYADSNYSAVMTFPLSINNPPTNISLRGDLLSWSDTPESSGYAIRINDQEIRDIEESEYSLEGLGDGFYTISIKAQGDYIYYKDSPYSKEFSYQVEDGNPVKLQLPTPDNLTMDFDVLVWDEVILAQEYLVTIYNGSGQTSVVTDTSRLSLAGYPDGLYSIFVQAIGDDAIYEDSNLSNEYIHIVGNYEGPTILNSPQSVAVMGRTENEGLLIGWSLVSNAISYQIVINNDIEFITNDTTLEISDYGVYKIRIRAIGDDINYTTSPFTKEYIFEKPTRLETPEDLHITGDMLSWSLTDYALRYQIEIKSNDYYSVATTINDYHTINLEDDGTYYIRVRAIGDGNVFIDSLFTQEVVYVLADGGLGGIDNPYLIESVEDLDLIRNYPSAYFRLLSDLNLEGVAFEPICDYNSPFSGNFAGNGFTISNLSIVSDDIYAGFFGYVNGGTIENLLLDNITLEINSYIEPVGEEQIIVSSYAGALYGYGNNVNISDVIITNAIIDVISNNAYLGLLGGYSTGAIERVKVDGSITSNADVNSFIGGVTGYINGSISDIIVGSADTVEIYILNSTNLYVGGLAGRIQGSDAIDIVVDINIVIEDSVLAYIGGLSGFIDNNRIENIEVNSTLVSESSESARIGGVAGQLYSDLYDITIITEINSSAANNLFIGGIAGEANMSLDQISAQSNIISQSSNAYVAGVLGRGISNIENGLVESSMVISIEGIIYTGGLSGDLTGIIDNLAIDVDTTIGGSIGNIYAGGIAGVFKGNITNSEISYSNIISDPTSAVFIGGAVGRFSEGNISDITIHNVNIDFISQQGDVFVGGAVGRHIQGEISNLDITEAIISVESQELLFVGGIVGESRVDINNSNVVIDIDAMTLGNNIFAGGIAGISNGVINDSIAEGAINVSGAGVYVGGIGGMSTHLNRVEYNGLINANVTEYTGESHYDPEQLPVQLQENFTDLYLGGIVGYISGDINKASIGVDSIYGKSIYGDAYVGGIVGNYSNSGVAKELSVLGIGDNKIEAESQYSVYVGGIAGRSLGVFNVYYDEERDQDIIPATVSENIGVYGVSENDVYVGGFAGYMSSNADNIYIRASVSGLSDYGDIYAGVIAGYISSATISNVSVDTDVTAVSSGADVNVGGVIGYMDNSTLSHIVSTASVTGQGEAVYMGGIVGYQDGSITYSYSITNEFSYNELDNVTLYLGGLSGYMTNGSILISYSVFEFYSELTNNTTHIGGLAGYINSGNIANTYAVVDIDISQTSNEDVIGGFAGYNSANISNSYATGSIVIADLDSTSAVIGNFIGINNRALSNVISDRLMRATDSVVGEGESAGIIHEMMSINCTQDGYNSWSHDIWLFRDNFYPRFDSLDSPIDTDSVSVTQQTIVLSFDSESLDLRDLLDFSYGEGVVFKNAYFVVEDNPYIAVTNYGIVDLFYNTPQEESININIFFEGYLVELSIEIITENIIAITGQGTAVDPYKIDSPELMRYLTFNTDSHFQLTEDIDMSSINWIPAGTQAKPFSGALDGNNKKIIGLSIDDSYQIGGLFGYTDGATVKDLTLDSINIDNNISYGDYVAGALIAYAYNTTIENIKLNGSISIEVANGSLTIGSLVGYSENVVIDSVESMVDINAQININTNYIGGLVARLQNGSSITNSLYKANINIDINGGGLYYGGLVAYSSSSAISASYSAAYTNIEAASLNTFFAGGLLGRIDNGTVQDSYSAAKIIVDATSVSTLNFGGFIGRNTAQVSRCYTLTAINISSVAEFIGFNIGTLLDSYFVSRASYTSTGVGNNNRTTGLNYIDSADLLSGDSIANWMIWDFDAGYFPRLKDLNYQNEASSVAIDSTLTIQDPTSIINILDYIQFSLDSNAIFQGVSIVSNNSSVLTILRGGFALVMGDGVVDIDITFDGGIVERITITIEGSQDSLFASGSGTELDPFVIVTIDHFNNIRQFQSSYFKLGNNLDFEGINWESIGTSGNPFTGYLDGDNYYIDNIQGESIFGYLEQATIINVNISNADITISDNLYAGILATEMNMSTINNIHIDALSTLSTSAQYTGGLVGRMMNSSYIINSSSLMPIAENYLNNRYIGGLVGRANSSYIDNSTYNVTNEFETSANQLYFGGLVGIARYLTIENSVSTLEIRVSSIENNLILGGLIALSEDSSVINSQFDITITINNDETNDANLIIGGLIAQSTRDNISLSTYTVTINATSQDTLELGGLIAKGSLSIVEDIMVDIDIKAVADDVIAGGIISSGDNTIASIGGDINMDIKTLTSSDTIIGGVVAENSGSVSNISNMVVNILVDSKSENSTVGGIIGYQSHSSVIGIQTTVINIDVDADNNVLAGGIIGNVVYNNNLSELDIDVTIGYDATLVDQEKDVIIGGLVGYAGNTISITNSDINTIINYIDAGRSNWIGGIAGKLNVLNVSLSEIQVSQNYSDNAEKYISYNTLIGALVAEALASSNSIELSNIVLASSINSNMVGDLIIGGIAASSNGKITIIDSDIGSEYIVQANQIDIGGIIPNGEVDINNLSIDIIMDIGSDGRIDSGAIGNSISGVIDNLSVVLDITLDSRSGISFGGLVSDNDARISNSEISGSILTNSLNGISVGGVSVNNSINTIEKTIVDVDIKAEIIIDAYEIVSDAFHNINVAGISAINNGSISDVSVAGSFEMNYQIDGIVTLDSSLDSINLTIGGVAAMNYGQINRAHSYANIEQTININGDINGATERNAYVGGLIGYNLSSIFDSITQGLVMASVDGADLYIGGALGYNDSQGIISVASVLSLSSVFIYHDDSVYYEYSGGFVGYHSENSIIIEEQEYQTLILASFYNTDTINDGLPISYWSPSSFAGNLLDSASAFVESGGKTSIELKTASTYPEIVIIAIEGVEEDVAYETWTDDIWTIVEGYYPELI